MKIPIRLIPILSFILCVTPFAYGQVNCVQMPDVSFFVPPEAAKIRWSDKELEEVIAAQSNADDPSEFFVPSLIRWLSDYEPACGSDPADERFESLLRLYSVIRRNEQIDSNATPISTKLRLIRADFVRQVNDDELFSKLVFSTDDGPLLGRTISPRVRPVASRVQATAFGKLKLLNLSQGVAAQALNKSGKVIWSRRLTGTVPDRSLKRAQLETFAVMQASLVVVATVFVDGERLTLYVRPNGRFMYYTHSW